MPDVANRKVISRLSVRSLKAAKLRNIMAICAIALTAVLLTTLFTLGIGMTDAIQLATMRQTGGNAHASVKYIDDEIWGKISAHPLVKEISYNRILCESVDNPELLKHHTEFWYHDELGLNHTFSEPTTGSRPMAENEVIMDTKTMQLLNVPREIGAAVKLALTVNGEQVERNFVLSGWWESDPAFNYGIIVTSKAYVDAHLSELNPAYREPHPFTGAVMAYIMFDNTFHMQNKLDRILTESGYDITDKDARNYVDSNLNWAYVSAGMGGDAASIVALGAAALLIILTGYLIIYNIFQISVLQDIRFYGLLKTIGTTRKQIKRIIRRQAAVLSIIGIPARLILGFAVGSMLVPLVMAQTIYAGTMVNVSANPLIFIGSALFAAVTVWVSVRKPGKIAAGVSPVEAMKYTDSDKESNKKYKQSTSGGKLYKMALSNLARNKKRTVLTLLSPSLSLVLLNSVFTLSRGLDMDKFMSKFVDNDFLVAHADYFNLKYNGNGNSVDEQVIQTLSELPGFEEGGRIYKTGWDIFTVEDSRSDDFMWNKYEDGNWNAEVFGLDDLPLSRLEVIEGKLDIDKLKSGKYILEGVHVDDFGRPMMESSHLNRLLST